MGGVGCTTTSRISNEDSLGTHRRDADVAHLLSNVAVHADREAVPRYVRELGEHVYREVERLLGWMVADK